MSTDAEQIAREAAPIGHGKLQWRNFKIVTVRINSGVAVSIRQFSGGFARDVNARRLSESERLRVGNHFAVSQTGADGLKINIV